MHLNPYGFVGLYSRVSEKARKLVAARLFALLPDSKPLRICGLGQPRRMPYKPARMAYAMESSYIV